MYLFVVIYYASIKNHFEEIFIKVGKKNVCDTLSGERGRLHDYVQNGSFLGGSQGKFTGTDTQGTGKTGINCPQ